MHFLFFTFYHFPALFAAIIAISLSKSAFIISHIIFIPLLLLHIRDHTHTFHDTRSALLSYMAAAKWLRRVMRYYHGLSRFRRYYHCTDAIRVRGHTVIVSIYMVSGDAAIRLMTLSPLFTLMLRRRQHAGYTVYVTTSLFSLLLFIMFTLAVSIAIMPYAFTIGYHYLPLYFTCHYCHCWD